jgi:hypothetical protein
MLPESKTYYSQLYRNFRAIEPTEYRRVVRFFEKYEKNILQLDFDEYFDTVFVYNNALFEIGEYRKHILMSDVLTVCGNRDLSALRALVLFCFF